MTPPAPPPDEGRVFFPSLAHQSPFKPDGFQQLRVAQWVIPNVVLPHFVVDESEQGFDWCLGVGSGGLRIPNAEANRNPVINDLYCALI